MSLDPQVNAELRREKQLESSAAPPLDPEFPYRKLRFDPFFFGLDLEVDSAGRIE